MYKYDESGKWEGYHVQTSLDTFMITVSMIGIQVKVVVYFIWWFLTPLTRNLNLFICISKYLNDSIPLNHSSWNLVWIQYIVIWNNKKVI